VRNFDGQVLKEVFSLTLERRIEDRYSGCPLHILQYFVHQYQHGSASRIEHLTDYISARRNAILIVSLNEWEAFLRVDLPGYPSPHCLNNRAILECLPVPSVELLAIKYRDRNFTRIGKALCF